MKNNLILISVITVFVLMTVCLFCGCSDDAVTPLAQGPTGPTGPAGATGGTGATGPVNVFTLTVNVTHGGSALSNASVTLSKTGVTGSNITSTDNPVAGGYLFTNLFSGDYLITASAPGYEIKTQKVTVTANSTVPVTLGQWVTQTSGTTQTLNSVYFTDNQTGWAVGGFGPSGPPDKSMTSLAAAPTGPDILLTTNGGQTWTVPVSVETNQNFNGVFFIDANRGWAVGSGIGQNDDSIQLTTDGGKNWTNPVSIAPQTLFGVFFIDPNTGWVVGDMGNAANSIQLTTDGGLTWTNSTTIPADILGNTLYSVYFTSATTGWAVGSSGIMLKTTDGGQTWTQQAGFTYDLTNIYFSDANNGWACGENSLVLKTTNGGASWTKVGTGLSDDVTEFMGINVVNNNIAGWVVGSFPMTIVHTENGGLTWREQSLPLNLNGDLNELNSVRFTDAQHGWAVGSVGTILHYSE